MKSVLQNNHDSQTFFHYKRQRVNNLFIEAARYPLVVISAGAGYGKTCAVHDFTEGHEAATSWIQLSPRDNVGARFWENCAHTIAQKNPSVAEEALKIGFPDTEEKIEQFQTLQRDHVKMKPRILVLDDFHYIEEPLVIRFLEKCILNNVPPGTSIFLISRSTPAINTASLVSKGLLFNISENDLRFTENELAQYFRSLEITPQPEHLREIMQDTKGWAFAINLIARSYQRSPGYDGYVRNAMKSNVFNIIETEIWNNITKPLQIFLTRLSLIDHLSIELVSLLADGDGGIIAELDRQNAYTYRDNYINAYNIHPLFLEFLAEKQKTLTEEQKHQTYKTAAAWCSNNGFKIDALSYYEKIGAYDLIALTLHSLPPQLPYGIAKYAAAVLDKAPEQELFKVEVLAAMHVAACICFGNYEKALSLAQNYEEKLLQLPEDNAIKNNALCGLYYYWGYLRILMCVTDDCYDFDIYFEKFHKYYSMPVDMHKLHNGCPGPWINAAGSSRKGSLDDYIGSLIRTTEFTSRCFGGIKTGEELLAQGELHFYKGNIHSAETFVMRTLELSRKHSQFEITHRALFYIMRINIVRGNFIKTEQALQEMKSQLNESGYINRFTNYDIAQCWYYCTLGLPEQTPIWLTDDFSPYSHAGFIENFANQVKALYCYTTKNYPSLLSYIHNLKQRESFLYGRVEMLAIEACVHYKMKDKELALAALAEAYNAASPNDIVMPFIELGKDMRTLSGFALKEPGCGIPHTWLENINRKASSYAKHQGHVIAEYRHASNITDNVVLSPREKEILAGLSRGLSRSEIAANLNLSINTVKMVISNVYSKLGAGNLADLIRIAAERKMI